MNTINGLVQTESLFIREQNTFMNGFEFMPWGGVTFMGEKFNLCVTESGEEKWCNENGESLSFPPFGEVSFYPRHVGEDKVIDIFFGKNLCSLNFDVETGELKNEILELDGRKYFYKDGKYKDHGHTFNLGGDLIDIETGISFEGVLKGDDGKMVHYDFSKSSEVFEFPELVQVGNKVFAYNYQKSRKINNTYVLDSGNITDVKVRELSEGKHKLFEIRYFKDGEEKYKLYDENGNTVKFKEDSSGFNGFIGNKKLSIVEINGTQLYLTYDFGGISGILEIDGIRIVDVDLHTSNEDYIVVKKEGDSQDICLSQSFEYFYKDGKTIKLITRVGSGYILNFEDGEEVFSRDIQFTNSCNQEVESNSLASSKIL